MKKGFIHIYFGGGKGKTTAAIGLAIRMAGSGQTAVIMQFLKSSISSERKILSQIDNIRLIDIPSSIKFVFDMNDSEKSEATALYNKKLDEIESIAENNICDMIVLDEILDAVDCGIIDEKRVLHLLDICRGNIEVVMTGRNPSEDMLKRADYITKTESLCHPFDKGIGARYGIEY